MTRHDAHPGTASAFLESRLARIRESVGRPLQPAGIDSPPVTGDRLAHLLREAQDLYWNELAWEQMTDEEAIAGGRFTELAFPAFLAFVDGLLPRGRPFGINAHPDVVEEILSFLAEQYLRYGEALQHGADSQRLVWGRAMTSRLVDLVLYRLFELTTSECEELDEIV